MTQAPSCERCKGTGKIAQMFSDPTLFNPHTSSPCPDCQPKPSEGTQFVVSPMMRIAELEATIERQATELEAIRNVGAVRASRISQLEAALAAARLNERRYLWLRINPNWESEAALSMMSPTVFDAQIDAAIAAGDGK